MGATNLKAVDNEIKRLDKIAEAARVRQARMAAAARAKSPTKLPAANGTPSQDVVMESAPTNGVAKTGDPASSSASDVQNGKPAEANGAPAPVAKAPDPNAEVRSYTFSLPRRLPLPLIPLAKTFSYMAWPPARRPRRISASFRQDWFGGYWFTFGRDKEGAGQAQAKARWAECKE
jgi:hypothetical protein